MINRELIAQSDQLAWIFTILALYWCVGVAFTIQGLRGKQSFYRYALGGQTLPLWLWLNILAAVLLSGWTILAIPALVYQLGAQAILTSLMPIFALLGGVTLYPRLRALALEHHCHSAFDLIAKRCANPWLMGFFLVIGVAFAILFVAVQLRLAGILLHNLTNGAIHVDFGMWMLALIVLAYAASGGVWTVARMAVVQNALTITTLLIMTGLLIYWFGGFERIYYGLSQQNTEPLAHHYPSNVLWLYVGLFASPVMIHWLLTARPQAVQGRWLVIIAVILTLLTALLLPLFGFLAKLMGAVFLDLNQDAAAMVPQLLRILTNELPWLAGILAVGLLAAIESTTASLVLSTGSLFSYDIVKRYALPNLSDPGLRLFARIGASIVVISGLLVVWIAQFSLNALVELALALSLQTLPLWLALCYWSKISPWPLVIGLVFGLATLLIGLPEVSGLSGANTLLVHMPHSLPDLAILSVTLNTLAVMISTWFQRRSLGLSIRWQQIFILLLFIGLLLGGWLWPRLLPWLTNESLLKAWLLQGLIMMVGCLLLGIISKLSQPLRPPAAELERLD